MKRHILILLSACLVLVAHFLVADCTAGEGGLRYSITVSKFENRSNWSGQWSLGDAWGAVFTDSLNQSGKFIVLGEKDMRMEALAEQDFAASGRAAGGGKAVTKGQMTPAQLLVKGEITHFAEKTEGGGGGVGVGGFRIGAGTSTAEINVVVYFVESTTGQVLASKKCYGKVSDTGLSVGLSKGGFSGDVGGFKKTNAGKAVEQAAEEAASFMVSKLQDIPWTGDVILVKGDSVYINRGTREGVSVGQNFDVGKLTILRDPNTGELLDRSLEKAGSIQVKTVREKISICTVTKGGSIAPGMNVMFSE